MCFSSPKPAPPPPPPAQLPEAPQMANVAAPMMTQSRPKPPAAASEMFQSKGKRRLRIQMGASPGVNIPGT